MWLKEAVFCLLFTLGVGLIVWHSFRMVQGRQAASHVAEFSASACTVLTLVVSLRLILLHLRNYVYPKQQKFVVRIVAIVPIYAVESYLALRFRRSALYIETLRECYEAYAIYSFLYYLISLFGDESELIKLLRHKSVARAHPWPLSLLISPWASAHEILTRCKVGVIQYVLVKNLCALVVFVLASLGYYEEGTFSFTGAYLYVTAVNSLSQGVALYCLVLFYFAGKDELAPWKPISKFLTVKVVIFWTWYQSVVVSYLAHNTNLIAKHKGRSSWSDEEIAKGIQDYAICIEMLFASIAFSYAFSHTEYSSTGRAGTLKGHSRDSNDGFFSSDDAGLLSDTADEDDHGGEKKEIKFFSAVFQASVPSDYLQELRASLWRATPLSPSQHQFEPTGDSSPNRVRVSTSSNE